MPKIFISPGKYIQGPGEIQKLSKYAPNYGTKAMVLISKGGYDRIGSNILSGFEAHGYNAVFEFFCGECSRIEIKRITELMKSKKCDLIIGIGGGKIADTAKAVAHYRKVPVIICPTIASTDAPCSALSVLYTSEGIFEEVLFLLSNPTLVIMDTELIAKSPVRLTVSGMGDALATFFETRACQISGALNCAGGKPSITAMAIARACLDTLINEGLKAKIAIEAGVWTESVDMIIEANTLLSGIGFESGGLAGAHAIHNGLTVLEECRNMYHGEKVAFGTISQLVLENIPFEELKQIICFCISVDLPVTLEQLGIKDIDHHRIMKVAMAACAENGTMHNMPFPVNPDMVASAIIAADGYGHYFLDHI